MSLLTVKTVLVLVVGPVKDKGVAALPTKLRVPSCAVDPRINPPAPYTLCDQVNELRKMLLLLRPKVPEEFVKTAELLAPLLALFQLVAPLPATGVQLVDPPVSQPPAVFVLV
jgi:hypothetical protein